MSSAPDHKKPFLIPWLQRLVVGFLLPVWSEQDQTYRLLFFSALNASVACAESGLKIDLHYRKTARVNHKKRKCNYVNVILTQS